jgi:hypothetical protein
MNNVKRIVGVVGSTGQQGGGLVRARLKDGDKSPFRVRALTRDPTKVREHLTCIDDLPPDVFLRLTRRRNRTRATLWN